MKEKMRDHTVLYPFTHAGSDAGGPVWRDFLE